MTHEVQRTTLVSVSIAGHTITQRADGRASITYSLHEYSDADLLTLRRLIDEYRAATGADQQHTLEEVKQ